MTTLEQARKDVLESRKALLATVEDVRARITPAQLAEDALSLIDPHLTLLGRLKSSVQHNRLLSLAILAGAGWLVGSSRRHHGEPQQKRDATTAKMRSTTKEKNSDSGNRNGHQRPDASVRHEAEVEPEISGKAQAGFGRNSFKAEPLHSIREAVIEPVER